MEETIALLSGNVFFGLVKAWNYGTWNFGHAKEKQWP